MNTKNRKYFYLNNLISTTDLDFENVMLEDLSYKDILSLNCI